MIGNIQASIITIGDELLIGQTIDTNSAWIAQQLNAAGIDVVRRVAVGDDAAMITQALDAELQTSALVLITGGLGPTADDITKPLLCSYFGGKLVVNEEVLQHVQSMFARRNLPFLERNMKQAEVPDNCTVLFNRVGTAPGMLFNKDGKYVISMPGVPFEMMAIMEDGVLPFIKQQFTGYHIIHHTIITSGEGESFIAERIPDLETALPEYIKLAYLPYYGGVKLRLTGKGTDGAAVEQEVLRHKALLAERLQHITIALEDIPLEKAVAQSLVGKKLSIGLAESCTGGYIAHHLTQIMGATEYFKGSLVCYQNEVKINVLGVQASTIDTYGAISEATVIEMCKGALSVLKSDVSFAITGLLSEGGEAHVPIGTVWMAIGNKDKVLTKMFRFHHDRHRNKKLATQAAMLMIWKFLNDKL